MFINEEIISRAENELKYEREEVSRGSKYPSFSIISEKPVFAEGNRLIQDIPRSQIDSKISAFQFYDRMLYDHIGASYNILQRIVENNSYVEHAMHVVATAVASATPTFNIYQDNRVITPLVENMTDLLNYPNFNETGYSLFYKTTKSLQNYGNSFWQIIRTLDGNIHSIYFLPSNTLRVVPFVNSDNGQWEFCYLQVNYMTNKVDKVYFQEDIIHFQNPNHNSVVYGRSSLVSLFKEIAFDEEAKNWITSWFSDSFTGGAMFKMPNANKDVVRRNRQEMKELYTGTKHAGKVMILEGDTQLVYDGNKAKEIDFSSLKYISRDTIYTCLGCPISTAGLRSKEGSGNVEIINAEEKAMLRNTVEHFQKIIFKTLELRLFRYILQNRKLFIEAGVNNLFNNKTSSDYIASASKYCGTSVNENRKIAGLPPIQDASKDEYYNKPIIATNNGLAPFDVVFDQFSNPNQANPKPDVTNGQITPTLDVSPEKGNVQIKN